MTVEKWIARNTESLVGKTVAISGATGGIGRELCAYLAALGAALILLDRNAERSRALRVSLTERFPTLSVETVPVDMEKLDTVKRAADVLLEKGVDYLVLNAGAYSIPRRITEAGYDNVFQINFVAPYYLARQLLPMISAREGRIVAVGSIAHGYSVTDPSDVDFRTRRRASLVYGNAKRHLMLALPAIAERGISVTHPGITQTNITAHYPRLVYAVIKYPMKVIFPSPKRAARSILRGLFEDTAAGEWIGPRVLDVWGVPKKSRYKTISEEERRRVIISAEQIYAETARKERAEGAP